MRKSRLSQAKQDRLIEHFVSGSTARTASALVGVNRNTAAYYFQRLRQLICLAMECGSVRANIVCETAVPVLVTKSPSDAGDTTGLKEKHRVQREPVAVHRALLLKPAAALVFRHAGIL